MIPSRHLSVLAEATEVSGLIVRPSTRFHIRDEVSLAGPLFTAWAIMALRAQEWAESYDLCPKSEEWMARVGGAWKDAMLGSGHIHAGETWVDIVPQWVGSGDVVPCDVEIFLNGELLVTLSAGDEDPETYLPGWRNAIAGAMEERFLPVWVVRQGGGIRLKAPYSWKGTQVDVVNGSCGGRHVTVEGPALVFAPGIRMGQYFGCNDYPARLVAALETLATCGENDLWPNFLGVMVGSGWNDTIYGPGASSTGDGDSSLFREFTDEFTLEFT